MAVVSRWYSRIPPNCSLTYQKAPFYFILFYFNFFLLVYSNAAILQSLLLEAPVECVLMLLKSSLHPFAHVAKAANKTQHRCPTPSLGTIGLLISLSVCTHADTHRSIWHRASDNCSIEWGLLVYSSMCLCLLYHRFWIYLGFVHWPVCMSARTHLCKCAADTESFLCKHSRHNSWL